MLKHLSFDTFELQETKLPVRQSKRGLVQGHESPLWVKGDIEDVSSELDNRVPSRHGGTLNSHRAESPLVRLVEGGKRWEYPDHSQGALPQNWGETEQNRTVTCMVLKAKDNDKRKILALSPNEFRGP
ncbi:uncharacterized protein TNCV_1666851 [Trichonephila clavipes]|nr:uncharacterized protein TNCV_1666851 [Trichonephila clavipes]